MNVSTFTCRVATVDGAVDCLPICPLGRGQMSFSLLTNSNDMSNICCPFMWPLRLYWQQDDKQGLFSLIFAPFIALWDRDGGFGCLEERGIKTPSGRHSAVLCFQVLRWGQEHPLSGASNWTGTSSWSSLVWFMVKNGNLLILRGALI